MQRLDHQTPLPRHASTATTTVTMRADLPIPSSSLSSSTSPPTTQPPPQHHIHPRPDKPNTRVLSLFLQALIMSLVILLFFVFIGVAAIIFLHICIAGGALHRRRRRRSSSSSSSDQQRRQSGTRSGGFSFAEVKTLPKTRYCKAKTDNSSSSLLLCSICLEEYREGDWCRELPDCKHCFHSKCVDRWLAKVTGCPVCRTTVKLKGGAVAGSQRDSRGDSGQLWAVFG